MVVFSRLRAKRLPLEPLYLHLPFTFLYDEFLLATVLLGSRLKLLWLVSLRHALLLERGLALHNELAGRKVAFLALHCLAILSAILASDRQLKPIG